MLMANPEHGYFLDFYTDRTDSSDSSYRVTKYFHIIYQPNTLNKTFRPTTRTLANIY